MDDKADPSPSKEPKQPGVDPLSSDRERLQFALAAAGMGVFEWDPNSDVLTWSSTTTGLGLSLKDAPANGRAFFEFVHPDDRSAILETRARAIREGTDAVSEFRIVSPNGVVHWVQARGRVVYDAAGRPFRVLGVNADITDRKSLEEERRQAQIQAERLNVLKATMRTVQNIVGNALTSLQLFRREAEPHLSSQSLESFDDIIAETAARLKALGDLEQVDETAMVMGTGIAYESGQTRKKPE